MGEDTRYIHGNNAGIFGGPVFPLYFECSPQRAVDVDILGGWDHVVWRSLTKIVQT